MPEVLIVDDDPDSRGMLAFVLADDGFRVREAKNGFDALVELSRHTPDCIVLDLVMPDLDGFHVLETMRDEALAETARVLVLTGKDDEKTLVRAWELGADEYLTRPVDPELVVAKITRLLSPKP